MKLSLAFLALVYISTIWAAPHSNIRRKRAGKLKSLPIPPNAKIPAPHQGKTYFSAKVAYQYPIYYVQTDGSVSMFVITSTGVVVIDAPPAIGAGMEQAIRDVTNLPVTHLIYTHSHGDHIGNANATIFKNAEKVAHEETAKVLAARNDPARPVPTITFSGCTKTVTLSGKNFTLDYKGPIHTPGNIFIWLPDEKILYTADMVSPGSAPYTRLGVAEDIVAYMEAMDKILAYPFTYFFGGHARLGTRQDVQNQKEYLQDVQKNALAAASMIPYQSIVDMVEDTTNGDLIFYLYNEAVAQKCADLTAAKWGNITMMGSRTLGYVDVYTKSSCDAIGIAQRIDYGPNKVIG